MLFAQVITLLRKKDLTLKKGTIVDLTIISAPSSTKNNEHKRDSEAHSVKKGTEWKFGYKAHVGVDSKSGLVHSLEVTAANVHDVTMTSELLTGEEVIYGDSGYIGAERRDDAITRNNHGKKKYIQNQSQTKSRIKRLSKSGQYKAKKNEHPKSSVRAKVEHVFSVIKNLFAFRKTRYRGKQKQFAKLNFLFALANFYLADRRFGLSV